MTIDRTASIADDGTVVIDAQLSRGWMAHYRFVRQTPGTYALAEVRVEPSGASAPPGGLTSRVLKRLAPFDALDEIAANIRRFERESRDPALPNADAVKEWLSEVRNRAGDLRAANNRPGRPPRSDAFYAHAAQRYIDLIPSGDPPIPSLARELKLKTAGAAGVIREARRRKLLSAPPSPGTAGGELTGKAKRLLRQEQRR